MDMGRPSHFPSPSQGGEEDRAVGLSMGQSFQQISQGGDPVITYACEIHTGRGRPMLDAANGGHGRTHAVRPSKRAAPRGGAHSHPLSRADSHPHLTSSMRP